MINLADKAKCCGCTACANVCPKQCIEMKADEEGFLYPYVFKDSCVNCGLCEKVCPIKNPIALPSESEAAYVVQSTEQDVLNSCTSGGFADIIGKLVVERGGAVYGVQYDNDFMPIHSCSETYDGIKKFRNSKYAQSKLGNIFTDVKEKLQNNQLVLFTGTPCQVSGLKSFLNKDYDNLLTVDLVCRSIPSPLLFSEYLEWQKKKYNSEITSLSCRNKTYGYHSGSLVIHFKNGKTYSGSNRVDPYMKSFHHDICSRPSCYECVFKTKTRCSDFTVFDSWNPKAVAQELNDDNDRGYSNVIVHTEKGNKLISSLKDVKVWNADAEKMFEFTGGMESNSIKMTDSRKTFYIELKKLGFEKTVKNHVRITHKDRFIEAVKPVIKNKYI